MTEMLVYVLLAAVPIAVGWAIVDFPRKSTTLGPLG
jgi:hypothetical protein